MSAKEQLLNEIENAPESMVEEVLDFCLFLKQRQQLKAQESTASIPQTNGILEFLRQVEAIQAQVPAEEWDKLPHDGSIHHDHYLYGSPKVEE
ncbi:hypothetical protein ACN4EK_11490 [Pantanalinema rosaneae CENA516]|uniref:hypothetical protein n=1 Tax=Pantanalinema rosaneae TaxID=1620701 RepID=UPI003D6EC26D